MLWKTGVGSMTVYAIEDGWTVRDPHEWFIGSTPAAWVGHEQYLTNDGQLPVSFGCFLVDTGTRLVMVDTGFGVSAPEMAVGEAGLMPAALAGLGVAPEGVTDVVHTHLHPDHILGDLDGDRAPFFPNATVWTHTQELAYWRSGVDQRSRIVMSVVGPLDAAGIVAMLDGGEVLPGIAMVETFGHTPGHTSILVSSGDDAVMIAGDICHSPMQVIHTDWNIGPDVDKAAAAATRRRFFADLAESGTPVAGGHLYRPGFGRIASRNDHLVFEALEVTAVEFE